MPAQELVRTILAAAEREYAEALAHFEQTPSLDAYAMLGSADDTLEFARKVTRRLARRPRARSPNLGGRR